MEVVSFFEMLMSQFIWRSHQNESINRFIVMGAPYELRHQHFKKVTLPPSQKSWQLSNLHKRRSKRASQKIRSKQAWRKMLRGIQRALKHCNWCRHSCDMRGAAETQLCVLSGIMPRHGELVSPFKRGGSSWAVTKTGVWFAVVGMHGRCGSIPSSIRNERIGIRHSTWGVDRIYAKVLDKTKRCHDQPRALPW